MPDDRRNRVSGRPYVFTANLLDRQQTLLTDHIAAFCRAVRETRRVQPFHIDAWVVLPVPTHCLWTLPDGDADDPGRWRALKKRFSKSRPPCEARSAPRFRRGERGMWHRRSWEHTIRDDADHARPMD